MDYQVTLFCNSGRYKPVSTIVKKKEAVDLASEKRKLVNEGAQKICYSKGWSGKDLQKYGYVSAKVRVYDKEKLDKEAKERYNKIKEEKYASGEWKRPKKED